MSIKNNDSGLSRIYKASIVKRNLAEANNHRTRNPVTRSRMTIRGQFPSTKMQRMIAWESQLERRACYLFEFSPNIESFREQPCRFMIPHEDQVRRYTPDFEVVWASGVISYFEIKPLKKLDQLREYWRSIHQFLNGKKYQFLVLTENELINPIKEQNLQLLRAYQNYSLKENVFNAIPLFLSLEKPSFSFTELVDYFGSISIVYALIAQKYLHIDLTQPLSPNTHIYWIKEGDKYYENSIFTYRSAPDFR